MQDPVTYAPLKAALWLITAQACGAALDAVSRHVASELHVFQIVFFCMGGALLLRLPWLVKVGVGRLKTTRMKLFLLRPVLEVAGFSLLFSAVVIMPLPQVSALIFMTPVLITVLAVVILREESSLYTWLSLLTGFVGVLIIVRPDVEGVNIGAVYVLLASLCYASCGIIIRSLSRTETPRKIVFYMMLFTAPLSLALALPVWQTPSWEMAPWCVALALLFLWLQLSVTYAIRAAPLTDIMPYAFTRIIFTAILAYAFFGEVVEVWTVLGAAIILGSAVVGMRRQRFNKVMP